MRPRSPPCLPRCALVPQIDVVDVGGVEVVALASAFSTVAPRCCGWMFDERALADLADAARRAAGVDDEASGMVFSLNLLLCCICR